MHIEKEGSTTEGNVGSIGGRPRQTSCRERASVPLLLLIRSSGAQGRVRQDLLYTYMLS